MILFEYEAKKLLALAGLNVPASLLVSDSGSVTWEANRFPALVKVQTPFGKRWEQGGIRFAKTIHELKGVVSDLLRAEWNGFSVEEVLIEDQVDYDAELFLSLGYDSLLRAPFLLFSPAGGCDIEELAATHPDRIWKMALAPHQEVLPHDLVVWLSEKGLKGSQLRDLSQILRTLIRQFFAWDAVLLEINPLVFGRDGRHYALDCHLEIDDEALPRQRLEALLEKTLSHRKRGQRKQTEFEAKAQEIDQIDYRGVAGRLIEFPGNLGLLIGGGGASLTVFDAILGHHGEPANYCEIGGNPTPEKVAKLTQLIMTRPKVEKLAVIMNVVNNTQADLVAEGVIDGIKAAGKIPAEVIVMFRLPGSGEEKCREILSAHNVPFTDRSVTIDEAAIRAVEAVRAVSETEVRK